MIEFQIQKKRNPLTIDEIEKRTKKAAFGRVFTEHMAIIKYQEDKGWIEPSIQPLEEFHLSPFNVTLHYAQEIFEGLKAYKDPRGEILLFRPEQNAKRFQNSASRLSMPLLPESLFLTAIEELVRIDKDWIPDIEGSSLYLRPFMFATDNFLGVASSNAYYFCVIASPAHNYFTKETGGLNLWLEETYARSGPGGTGAIKCGGNYAASFKALEKAKKAQCQQALFLDAVEHKWIEELGGMNIFFVTKKNHLITPSLNGNILPGITRDSLLILAKKLGYVTEEKMYSFAELKKDVEIGKVIEAFACGTAAFIVPIEKIKYEGGELLFSTPNAHSITQELKAILGSIQQGRVQDHYGWIRKII